MNQINLELGEPMENEYLIKYSNYITKIIQLNTDWILKYNCAFYKGYIIFKHNDTVILVKYKEDRNIPCKHFQKKGGISILILDKVAIETSILRDKE